MNIKKDFYWLPILVGFCIVFFIFQNCNQQSYAKLPFFTQQAKHRDISAIVKRKGILVPEEIIMVGNAIPGIIRYLYAAENDLVKEGQLLAEIDDSKEDSGINTTFGALNAAQATLKYQVEFLKRQEQLYGCRQISLDAYQQAERNFQEAFGRMESAKGAYEREKIMYDAKRIKAPISGMIISKRVSVGESVANLPNESILYLMAKNAQQLEAHIILDDKDLEIIKPKLDATIRMNTYPYEQSSLNLEKIKKMPPSMEAYDSVYRLFMPQTEHDVYYCAVAPFANDNLHFKPGMTFSADIIIGQKENVLSICQRALDISTQSIEQLAYRMGYDYRPITRSSNTSKTIWVIEHKAFIQKEISTGVSDGVFIEVIKGLNGSENVICGIQE